MTRRELAGFLSAFLLGATVAVLMLSAALSEQEIREAGLPDLCRARPAACDVPHAQAPAR